MNANEAAQIANIYNQTKREKTISDIYKRIKDIAEIGEYDLYYSHEIDSHTIAVLRSASFEVRDDSQDGGYSYIISWL